MTKSTRWTLLVAMVASDTPSSKSVLRSMGSSKLFIGARYNGMRKLLTQINLH